MALIRSDRSSRSTASWTRAAVGWALPAVLAGVLGACGNRATARPRAATPNWADRCPNGRALRIHNRLPVSVEVYARHGSPGRGTLDFVGMAMPGTTELPVRGLADSFEARSPGKQVVAVLSEDKVAMGRGWARPTDDVAMEPVCSAG
jgi:hypothetical protein